MLVASNTSPLCNLAIIGRLDLVQEQMGEVAIPPAVAVELNRHPKASDRAAVHTAIEQGWIRVVPLAGPVPRNLAQALDLGEAEALALASQARADLILLDESAARARAAQFGLTCTGVLGILRRARQTNRIPSLSEEIRRLRKEPSFFVGPALERGFRFPCASEGHADRTRSVLAPPATPPIPSSQNKSGDGQVSPMKGRACGRQQAPQPRESQSRNNEAGHPWLAE